MTSAFPFPFTVHALDSACHPESAFFADDKVPGVFSQGKDLVLNQILPPVGRQNDIKSLSSRVKTRDQNLPLLSSRAKTRDLVLPLPVIPSEAKRDVRLPAEIWTCPCLSS